MPFYTSKNSHPWSLILLLVFVVWQTVLLYQNGWSLFQNVNLVFHEAGHTLFLWAPQFVMVLMGSGLELLIPLSITVYFYLRREYVGAQFGLWWTGTALWSIGIYAADGLDRNLPLIGNIDKTYHDWYYLLLETGWLYSAEVIGNSIYFVGSICILSAIVWIGHSIYTTYHSI